jgi:hypothetical protein
MLVKFRFLGIFPKLFQSALDRIFDVYAHKLVIQTRRKRNISPDARPEWVECIQICKRRPSPGRSSPWNMEEA